MLPSVRHLLHRQIWQRLPRSARRDVFLRLTAFLAPRPRAALPARQPLIVAGSLRSSSGLGQSARLCYAALAGAGFDVRVADLTTDAFQDTDLPVFEAPDGRRHEGSGTLILHINGPLVPLALLRLGRRFLAGKRIIGYWAWELPEVGPDWRRGVPFVHEIWVPSEFVAHAVQPVAQGVPVRVVPHPVALLCPPVAPRRALESRPFTVLCVFNMASGFTRKNPVAAIEAFKAAFGDDASARLLLKATNLGVHPDGRRALEQAIAGAGNIHLSEDAVTSSAMVQLYDTADILVSLHRSEGFGLVMAEAMLRGLAVVATDWSGNRDFLTVERGCPVHYRLVKALDPQGVYDNPRMVWAEPDVSSAAAALRRLRDDATVRLALGEAGMRFGREVWSAERYAELVSRHLAPLAAPSRPE
ncbi:MAG: glycosyltransferase family 4 protein [Hyphomicrobiaceae bacterium]